MINQSDKFRYYLYTDNVTLRFRHRGEGSTMEFNMGINFPF